MEVVVLKYMQIVCITIFMNNANCAQIMVKSEEMNNIKVAACAADCIKTMTNVSRASLAIQIVADENNANLTLKLFFSLRLS